MRVFDSNILIYHLNEVLPPDALASVEAWISEGAMISVITRIEVLGYPQTDDQFQQAARLLAYFDEISLHEPIVQRTITLRQQSRIRLPDALIAATALCLGFPLVTRNTHDFRAIEDLLRLGVLPEGYIYPKAERLFDDTLGSQLTPALGIELQQRFQHLVGMLAQQRGMTANAVRAAGQPPRGAHQRTLSHLRMRPVGKTAPL